MAPTTRSTGSLRRSKRLASDALRQPHPKRQKRHPQPTKQPTPHRNSSARPSNTAELQYRQCEQTLFLSNDFETIHWQPAHTKASKYRKPICLLGEFNMNVHEYFISVRAGSHAASEKMFMYRHVGSIFLNGFQVDKRRAARRHFKSIVESEERLVNLNQSLNGAHMSDSDLLTTLLSLTRNSENLWSGPLIVLVGNRDQVAQICSSKKETTGGLTAQVYVGRLLFELIACDDIKQLFQALRPSVPYTPVPTLPEYQQVFSRSAAGLKRTTISFRTILRNAESLGYATLTDQQEQKIEEVLEVKLFPFQEQTVRWMLDMENGPNSLNDFFWEERSFTGTNTTDGGSFYYFPLTGELRLRKPPSLRGGMITEEMGLGKTIEALAVIAAQRTEHKPYEVNVWCETDPTDIIVRDGIISMRRVRQKNNERTTAPSGFHHGDEVLDDAPNKDFPKNVRVRRWPPKTTLVVCPTPLIGQWKQEAHHRAPSLSVELWEADADRRRSESNNSSTSERERDGIAVGENAKDVVIASYEALRKDNVLSQICWRRLILDEAQMTRRSTAQIAQDVFNLRASSRFLMTGTPIVNSVNDLKGELAMLKVWPFTLENDGFWEHHIQAPFNRRQRIPLLDQFLKVTMMRHTKGQNLGITLPPRMYETVEVDLVGSHRASYCFVMGSCLEELEAQGSGDIDTRRLRIFLRLMVTICLSADVLDLSSLDLARRYTWSRRPSSFTSRPLQPGVPPSIPKVSPVEAIEFVAESASRVVRHTERSFATGHANISNELDRFLRMPIEQLRQEVMSKKLISKRRMLKLRRERLAALAAGGVHRLATDTLQELRATAVEVGIVDEAEAMKLSRATAMAKLQQHYDLLNGIERTRTVHESGFLAITKIMELKGNPSCPVCLTDCDERISITKCGHIYCLDCMLLMLESTIGCARCAICRRDVSTQNVIEIERPKCDPKAENNSLVIAKDEPSVVSVSQVDSGVGQPTGSRTDKKEPQPANSGEAPNDPQSCVSDGRVEISKPTAREAWAEYEQLGEAPSRFQSLGRDPGFPSLEPRFLRHLAAVRGGLESPKLSALHSLILGAPKEAKFCVVAASIQSLRVIHDYLSQKGICCVGAGVPANLREPTKDASSQFSEDPNVRVFLLNPGNSCGLTLIAAQYVIFMETLLRVADEVQAAARVHRIGQTKPVKIIRMVARNTIEELMIQQRGEIRSPEEESAVLSAINRRDASDKLILDLLRDE